MKNTIVSLFRGYSDTCPVDTPLEEVVRIIKHDASLYDCTRKHRYYLSEGIKTVAAREKSSCPCFAVAVRFEGGKQKKHIAGWTGLSLADLDHVPAGRMEEVLRLVREDSHTLLAYTTVSGQGIRVIFGYELSGKLPKGEERIRLYKDIFLRTNDWYAKLTGCKCDAVCKNATRLSGLAWDENVFFREDAEPFRFNVGDFIVPASRRNGKLERAVAVIRKELEQMGVCYQEHNRNNYIMRSGYLFNKLGIPMEEALAWAQERFTDYDGDIAAIFRSCYADTSEFGSRSLRSSRKEAEERKPQYATADEIEAFLDTQASFRHNVITNKCEVLPQDGEGEYTELTDRYVNSVWSRMSKEGMLVRPGELRMVLESDYVRTFNPFHEYFGQLPEWDGTTDFIGELADTVRVCGSQDHFRDCFRKWLVASVASMLDEGTVNHEILVLVGRQGAYKTTWLHRLLPPELRRYFCVKPNSGQISKDDVLTLSEFALVCLEEIEELRSFELNRLKALVTIPDINERRAYAHYKEKRPHIASFCATTNNIQFLSDLTGNRRWLPFEVEDILNPYTYPLNYEGVYAQAYSLWKGGFRYWFEGDEIHRVNEVNERFQVASLETDLILTLFRRPMPDEECDFVTTAYILAMANSGLKQPLSVVKLGLAMKKAGFEPVRVGGKRGYRVVLLTTDEITRNRRAMGRYTAGDDA